MSSLADIDPAVAAAIERDCQRQSRTINLIAAENYASQAVLTAQGSVLTNKYAEGYPGQRYYRGCENVDTAESLAIQRAKDVFGADHANVQPHSGAQANMSAYFALLQPGDTVMAMGLAHGGHLTHGAAFNFSGKLYNFVSYEVDRETERIDYDRVAQIAIDRKPNLIVAGASSYPRIIDFERFRGIADRVGARLMVDMAHVAGLVAGGVHPSPVPHADVVTSTTHKTLRGPRGGMILCKSELASSMDSSVFPGVQGGPLMHAIAAKAVAFHEAMQPDFVSYQRSVVENARVLADELAALDMRLVTGGTDNHMVMLDVSRMGMTGAEAAAGLEAAGITTNRNAIPFDTLPPRIASGIRLGTPAVTSRGFGTGEIRELAHMIVRRLSHLDDEVVRDEIRKRVEDMCRPFPVPGLPA